MFVKQQIIQAIKTLIVLRYLGHCLFIGDLCTIQQTGVSGICKTIQNCNSAIQMLKRNERPQHCGFDGFDPIVCCEVERNNILTATRKPGAISSQKCLEYSKLIYPDREISKCPIVNEGDYRVIQPEEFPFMGLIGNKIFGTIWKCPAVLISENFIITTTDCLYNGINGSVRLGAKLNQPYEYEKNVQIRDLVELIPFPDYLSRRTNNNLALAKLSSPVNFNEFVYPACLYKDEFIGNRLYSGGGDFEFIEEKQGKEVLPENKLQEITKVFLETIQYNKCVERFKPMQKSEEVYICAALLKSNNDKQCSPTGPLIIKHPKAFCMQAVIGIHTFTVPSCDGVIQPIAYTKVSNYIEWIEKIVWGSKS